MVYANYSRALIDVAEINVIMVVFFVAAAKLFKLREDYTQTEKIIET